MSNIRLFFSENLSINFCAKLNKPQSHYLNKVMRVKENENFSLFNHKGEWEAKISNVSKGIVEFNLTRQLRQKENLKEIWLAFSPIKLNYLNIMIQKATELGVTKFIPIITDRTIVRKVNLNRLEKIVVESSEQSNRLKIPTIEKAISLENFIEKNKDLNVIFGDLNTDNMNLNKNKINDKNPLCVLIGPEGDFTELERKKIFGLNNLQCLKISHNILRSETAAIATLSIINYLINL